MSQLAPIVLFVYNRPEKTKATLNALSNCHLARESDLIVFSDGHRNNANEIELQKIQEVRQIVHSENRFKTVRIVEREVNMGLANSIITGVTDILSHSNKIIVLEDDILVTKHFLTFLNEALNRYEKADNVYQISGFNFEVDAISESNSCYFVPFISAWGWATWGTAWSQFLEHADGFEKLKEDEALKTSFNLDGAYDYSKMLIQQMESTEISSWAVRWLWTVFVNNGLCLFPDKSLTINDGYDSEATHTSGEPIEVVVKREGYEISNFPIKATVNVAFWDYIKLHLKYINSNDTTEKQSVFSKIINRLRSIK